MKLKTLEDLDAIDLSDEIPELARDRFISSIQLKNEAIKWVKEFEEAGELMTTYDFKEFHNITSEDLK